MNGVSVKFASTSSLQSMSNSSMSYSNLVSNDLNQVCQSVPAELTRLIRMVVRKFYGFELYLCMEMLMIYPCLKEEDLAELLRLDLKTVHQYLINLKKEKFLTEHPIMETNADGKSTKHSYFYINYKMMVNIIKYKLHRIRQQIELNDNQSTKRANFICTNCKKTYTDLDTKEIFLTMTCSFCGAEVEEDMANMPQEVSRNLLSKFNTQTKTIYDLLARVENVHLADFILRPKPVDLTPVLERISSQSSIALSSSSNSKSSQQLTGKSAMVKFDKWSGDKTRNTDLLGQTRISINFDSNNSANNGQYKAKELPAILLANKTHEEEHDANNRDSLLLNSVKMAADATILKDNVNSLNNGSANGGNNNTNLNKTSTSSNLANLTTSTGTNETTANLETIIMQKLLKHEKKGNTTTNNTDKQGASSLDSSPKSTTSTTQSAIDSIIANPSKNGLINGIHSKSTSSITITKKRNYEDEKMDKNSHISSLNGHSHNNLQDLILIKKRKLNNGGNYCYYEINIFLKTTY